MFSDQLKNLEHQVDITHQINCVIATHINEVNTQMNSMQNTLNILL